MPTTEALTHAPAAKLAERRGCRRSAERLGMTLDEMIEADPIRASQPMPDSVRTLLRPDPKLYTRSASDPQLAVTTERLGASDLWSVSVRASGQPLHAGLTGEKQVSCAAAQRIDTDQGNDFVDGTRPPWLDLEYVPKLLPFRASVSGHSHGLANARQFIEPLSHAPAPIPASVMTLREAPLRFSYPWCTIGRVYVGKGTDFANPTRGGSGVLVGRNLMLTASHVAPWNRGPGDWWMRFVPGFRSGDKYAEPHGSSYVEQFYGTYVDHVEAGGQDYVICKLYTPLGDALGWMGSRSFGDEDEYISRRYTSVGYPDSFFGKPAVEFDIDIDDIDWDGGGLELETTHGTASFGDGWSGGPLWLWENEKPWVVGLLSGSEVDEFDPRRWVFAGGRLLVERVKFGLVNFA